MKPGFTLFELLIALCIAGILSALAYPSYARYLRMAYRSQAKINLIQLTAALQQYQDKTGSFDGATLDKLQWPKNTRGGHYHITLELMRDEAFEAIAEPQGKQANDRCGVLRINEANLRLADSQGCW